MNMWWVEKFNLFFFMWVSCNKTKEEKGISTYQIHYISKSNVKYDKNLYMGDTYTQKTTTGALPIQCNETHKII